MNLNRDCGPNLPKNQQQSHALQAVNVEIDARFRLDWECKKYKQKIYYKLQTYK